MCQLFLYLVLLSSLLQNMNMQTSSTSTTPLFNTTIAPTMATLDCILHLQNVSLLPLLTQTSTTRWLSPSPSPSVSRPLSTSRPPSTSLLSSILNSSAAVSYTPLLYSTNMTTNNNNNSAGTTPNMTITVATVLGATNNSANSANSSNVTMSSTVISTPFALSNMASETIITQTTNNIAQISSNISQMTSNTTQMASNIAQMASNISITGTSTISSTIMLDNTSYVATEKVITTSPTTAVATTKSYTTLQCIKMLFGDIADGEQLPYWTLEMYGATAPPTTTTTTTLTTLQIKINLCKSYRLWKPVITDCNIPSKVCFYDVMKEIDDYFDCKRFYNGSEPSKLIKIDYPMLLNSFMGKLANQIVSYFIGLKTINPKLAEMDVARMKSSIFPHIVWMVGLKYRYSDALWPDYTDSLYKHGKWNNRNDSILVPYGLLPRGEYNYYFSMYENLNENEISSWNVRLRETWEYKHVIFSGDFIDDRFEPDFYNNPKLEINSAIIQLTIKPEMSQPLPSYMTITLTHKRPNMVNPVCVYWQYIKQDVSGKLQGAGYWSNYGMTVRKTNSSMTVCRSTHYGAFAVLMEPAQPIPEEPVDLLGLCGILLTLTSIIMLLVFIVAMLMLRTYQTANSRMYIYMAVSLFFAQCFYIYAYLKRKDQDTCNFMADWNAFWYTAVMSWIMLESVFHYSQVHQMFSQRTNKIVLYNVIGWGFPVSVGIATLDFPFQEYDELRYCWPYVDKYELFYFGGPLLALLFTTIIIKMLTFLSVKKSFHKIEEPGYQQALKSMKPSFVITTTLSLAWCVGTFGLHQTNLMQKIILLLLPGLHIVMAAEIMNFYFTKNEEVIDALLEQKKIRMTNRLQTYSHLQGVVLDVNYQAQDDNDVGEKKHENAQEDGEVNKRYMNSDDESDT